MIIEGIPVDHNIIKIEKSIADNLRNRGVFQSENKDTATNTVELQPPIPMNDCLFIFQNSSYVAKCSRILAADIIYNDITLTPDTIDEPDEKLINQVKTINQFLIDNTDEMYYMLVDYNYAGWSAVEYVWNNTRFKLKQIPIHTCKIIKISLQGSTHYLLKQQINATTKYFKIMGEDYPDELQYFEGNKLGYASLLGGDNIYQFFSLPKWVQDYKKILTEIAITSGDYKTISNGNISSGVLNINLEPQIANPIKYDEEGKIIPVKQRQEVIKEELQGANGGTAVIFTESNRPLSMDYVSLTNNNQSYLMDISEKCHQSVLNDYNIPLVRLMINTDKESMNSDKTKSIWEIYTLNLKNENKPVKQFIRELIMELYSIPVNVDISAPIFSSRKEIEVGLISQAWNDGALTLKQFVTGLSEYLNAIDIQEYDFTINPEIWDYRKLPELTGALNENDLALIEEVEAKLNETHQ